MFIGLETLNVDPVDVGASPVAVKNWEYFDGSLLAIGVQYGDRFQIEGTAVMIGLGLAISAKHVLDEHMGGLDSGEGVLLCAGMRPEGRLEVWYPYEIQRSPEGGGDLALLSLRLGSDVPPGGRFTTLPLTTRVPRPGEHLTAVGFRFDEPASTDPVTNVVDASGSLYVSRGAAGELGYPIYHSFFAPYPAIEIRSGTLGGMSGGAVFDSSGALVGIISRGLQTDDQEGPSFAAWWLPVFCWRPKLSWPTGMYEQDAAVAAVSELRTVNVIGREHVTTTADGEIVLNKW